jgi:hypothetical protein
MPAMLETVSNAGHVALRAYVVPTVRASAVQMGRFYIPGSAWMAAGDRVSIRGLRAGAPGVGLQR